MSSSSSSSSKPVFLTDYIESLRQKGLLTANDFAKDHLEDLDTLARDIAVLKNLSNDSKTKLQIQQIVNKIGVSLVEENNHIKYATQCTTILKDTSRMELIVNKSPPGDTKFQIPNDGPVIPEPSKIKAETKAHGFKALDEAVLIYPVWAPSSANMDSSLCYTYDRGIPFVARWPTASLNKEGALPASFAWHLTQYCAYNPEKPDEVGEERFIFAGTGKGNIHPLRGCYMRVEDLKRRLQKGSDQTATKDLEYIRSRTSFFPLWDSKGTLLDEASAVRKFIEMDPNETKGATKEMSMFESFCYLARLARIHSGFNYILARFWDQPWTPHFILQIDPKYLKDIGDRVKKEVPDKSLESHNWDPKMSDVDRRLTVLIERLKLARQFQPNFEIRWGMDDIDPSRRDWSIWEKHPNEIYRLWINSDEKLYIMFKPKLGIWLDNRVHLYDEDLLAADEVIKTRLESLKTYKDAKSAALTVTKVTSSKVNVVRNYERDPDQITAMGKLSPNDLVRKWWSLGEKEQAAEWLHRSAFSYGGIETGKDFNPQSSQVMSNLIIGTREANTMMIRHEIFVKRLAHYTKEPVQVTTTLRQLFAEDLPPVAWYSPRLKYDVENSNSASVPVNYTEHFMTISRRLPTRLELDLDGMFERLAYGWTDDDDDLAE